MTKQPPQNKGPHIIEYRIFGTTKNPRDLFNTMTKYFEFHEMAHQLPHHHYVKDNILIENHIGSTGSVGGNTTPKWAIYLLGRELSVQALYHYIKALAHHEAGIDSAFFGTSTTYYLDNPFDPTKFASLHTALEHLNGRSGHHS